jgi:tetratricopeptide (TPR) repeat protein
MNEEPKNIWKKSWKGPRAFLFWLMVVAIASFLAALTITVITSVSTTLFDRHAGLGNFAGCVLVIMTSFVVAVAVAFIFYGIVRWLFRWRNFKRFLFGCACFATLIALFYAEEDWRGWHAWQKFKHQWEAKGERFDFASVVPPSVPDDQNFAMAPIWVESMKAQLGPKNSRLWYGDKFPDNGRTNFTDRLALNLWRNNDWANSPTNGDWAKGTITDLKPWQAYYRAPAQTNRSSAIATNEFPIASQPQTPAADVLLALSKYDSAIEELREASRLPYSRFPLNYDSESPGAILLPHLAALKRCSQALQLRAIAELQNGQPEKALADVKLALQLTDKIRTEPFLISHLVRIAMMQITLQPIWEGLAEHRWSEEQLVALDAELAKLDFFAAYKLSMDGELACQDGEMDYLRLHPEQLQNFSGYYDDEGNNRGSFLPGGFAARLIPTGWFYQNQFRSARMMVEYFIPVADVNQQTISPSAVRRADEVRRAETKKTTHYNILEKMLLQALGNAVKKFAHAQSSVSVARVAIALERYRLAHGEFPVSLDALAPQFIAKLPHDIINGQPLHYRHTSDPSSQSSDAASGQFVLYSVGWNETDDDGVVGLKENGSVDINTGDWVWRYSAK